MKLLPGQELNFSNRQFNFQSENVVPLLDAIKAARCFVEGKGDIPPVILAWERH